ncbi:YybH family protein [Pseudomonas sp. 5P_3.1_Bac2]|uniref:YybH family protein n=1 Tax=Pseudomonas sp. 5P_3.1_Bac2 TaxID=2971617 RepID=UPI0021C8B26C|nr:nuclear transport factor 2 family protein [Pseudomonas sp. 5P_3.1_Bac2]MCU1716229.1 nuclear transport factor 2 family protein [Pseudomonas sp. 5P_3.1_Bac2]
MHPTPGELVKRYGLHLKKANLSEILELYTTDAEIIPDGLASLAGTANIRQFYEHTFASIAINGELQVLSEQVYQDVAVVRCEEPADILDKTSGAVLKTYFREVFILEKTAADWKIKTYMFSQNPEQNVVAKEPLTPAL